MVTNCWTSDPQIFAINLSRTILPTLCTVSFFQEISISNLLSIRKIHVNIPFFTVMMSVNWRWKRLQWRKLKHWVSFVPFNVIPHQKHICNFAKTHFEALSMKIKHAKTRSQAICQNSLLLQWNSFKYTCILAFQPTHLSESSKFAFVLSISLRLLLKFPVPDSTALHSFSSTQIFQLAWFSLPNISSASSAIRALFSNPLGPA